MLSDIINISSVNISKLALFIFIIGGNFTGDIFSCSIRRWLKTNMLAKHLVAFTILLLFIGLAENDFDMKSKLLLTIGLYSWFIFIMRSPIIITTIVIFLIVILYIIQGFVDDNVKVGDDTTNLIMTRNVIFMCSVLLSVIGFIYFLVFTSKKYKRFSLYKFLIGLHDWECFHDKIFK